MTEDKWNYYVVTMEYLATGEGLSRALMICFAENETQAKENFGKTYGYYFASGAEVVEGINIPNGYDCLLTDMAKKVITSIKSHSPDAPAGFYYTNYIHMNYS